jgi:acyl-CoA thioester hydrolase
VRVARVGRTSVHYELAVYRTDNGRPAAAGHFVHVYVDRATAKPAPVPAPVRAALTALATPQQPATEEAPR